MEEGSISVTVLELRSERELCSTPGSLRLSRHGAEALGALGLEAYDDADENGAAGRGRTSKRKLLRALVGSLRGVIAFDTHVDGIQRAGDGKVVVTCSRCSGGDDRRGDSTTTTTTTTAVEYRFDAVVGADGLTSQSRGVVNDHGGNDTIPYFLIGDASRPFGRELCFGLARSRYGASRAMQESLRLAQALTSVATRGETLTPDQPELAPFTLTTWRNKMLRNAVLLLGMAGFLILCLAYGGRAG
jgi:hypothetical protein